MEDLFKKITKDILSREAEKHMNDNLPKQKKAAMKASLAIAQIFVEADLDPAQRMDMLISTFVANYFALRDSFQEGIDEAVIEVLTKEITKLDDIAKQMRESGATQTITINPFEDKELN